MKRNLKWCIHRLMWCTNAHTVGPTHTHACAHTNTHKDLLTPTWAYTCTNYTIMDTNGFIASFAGSVRLLLSIPWILFLINGMRYNWLLCVLETYFCSALQTFSFSFSPFPTKQAEKNRIIRPNRFNFVVILSKIKFLSSEIIICGFLSAARY